MDDLDLLAEFSHLLLLFLHGLDEQRGEPGCKSEPMNYVIAFEDVIGIFEGPIYTDVSETERRIISAWRAERHE